MEPNITFIMALPNGQYIGYEGIVDLQAQTFRLLTDPLKGDDISRAVRELEKAGCTVVSGQTRDNTRFFVAKHGDLPGTLPFWYRTVIGMMRRAKAAHKPESASKILTMSIRPGPFSRLLHFLGLE